MLIWGGLVSNGLPIKGGRYNPSTNSWVATTTTGAPDARATVTLQGWTGSETIVWGGSNQKAVGMNGPLARAREGRGEVMNFFTVVSSITIASPLEGGSGLTGKTGRKTANACGANASAMTMETTARLTLAEQYVDRSSGTCHPVALPAFVMTPYAGLFGSSCLKTGHDYGVQKDCRKHDLIAVTPPSLSDPMECVVR